MENYDYKPTAAFPYVNCLNSLRHPFRTQNPESLQPTHNGLPRPFTLEEYAEARVTTFNSETDDRMRRRLFTIPLDSCTAVAYKEEGSSKFKVIPLCKQLILANVLLFQVEDYHGIDQEEFDAAKIGIATDFKDIPEDHIWRTAFAHNADLLRAYCDIVASLNTTGRWQGALSFAIPERAPRDRRLYALRLIEAPFADVRTNDLAEDTYMLWRKKK